MYWLVVWLRLIYVAFVSPEVVPSTGLFIRHKVFDTPVLAVQLSAEGFAALKITFEAAPLAKVQTLYPELNIV